MTNSTAFESLFGASGAGVANATSTKQTPPVSALNPQQTTAQAHVPTTKASEDQKFVPNTLDFIVLIAIVLMLFDRTRKPIINELLKIK